MRTRVVVGRRVRDFLKSLAPEPRRKLWHGIKDLSQGKGDIKQLEGKLAPYWRLRVNNMRVIFDVRSEHGRRTILCFFADYRATVYSILEQLLTAEFLEQLRN